MDGLYVRPHLRAMTDNEQQKQESLSVGSLMLGIVGGAVGLYLAGFALLALIPGLGRAIGLSPVTFDKIYYPILKLLGL